MFIVMVRWGKFLRDCCWFVLVVVVLDIELFGFMFLLEFIVEGIMIYFYYEEEWEIIVVMIWIFLSKELFLEGDYCLKIEGLIVWILVIVYFGIVFVWFLFRIK